MKMWRGVVRISPRAARALFWFWYQLFVVLDRDRDISFMNYGYADLDPGAPLIPMSDEDTANRWCIQLYHHVAGAIDLRGKDVLEVGSGRGGGAHWVARSLGPRSVTGIDFSEKAIAFAKDLYAADNLEFRVGDALQLPLPDSSVDAVVNVESSHCYVSMERFLGEVCRVLRPGGHFLFTDHRPKNDIDKMRAQLLGAGLKIVRETDITANIVRALEMDHDRRQRLVDEKAPMLLKKQIAEFAGTVGSRTYESFRAGDSRYLSFVLQRS